MNSSDVSSSKSSFSRVMVMGGEARDREWDGEGEGGLEGEGCEGGDLGGEEEGGLDLGGEGNEAGDVGNARAEEGEGEEGRWGFAVGLSFGRDEDWNDEGVRLEGRLSGLGG
jgi:hypothetical protein